MKSLLLFAVISILKVSFVAVIDSSNSVNNKSQLTKSNDDEFGETNISYRLPTDIIPNSYLIRVYPSLDPLKNFSFTGKVKIKTHVVKATNKIVLHHGRDLKINTYRIINNVKIPTIQKYDYDEKTEKLTIVLNETLEVNSPTDIEMSYTGFLSKNTKGFYVSSYSSNQTQQYIAATQFQAIYARQTFPCFDEPQFKANFSIIVQRSKSFRSVSNTSINRTISLEDNEESDTFEITKEISPYQVAFFIFNFNCLVDKNVELKLWSQPETIQYTTYAFNISLKVRDFFTELFEKNYLSKLDMIAVPDLSSGAIGNWRLITFGESRILYDVNYNGVMSQRGIAYTIAHQLALQLFGNVVSPNWWKDIWLSVGLAQYFQYAAVSSFEPTWNSHTQIVVDQLHKAFSVDSLLSAHPMSNDVYSPSEIENMFDTITYMKSASILRMAEKVFGADIFYKALNKYLIDRQYQSSTPENLYEAFQNQLDTSGIKLPSSVKTSIDSWTLQAGFPVIHVKIVKGQAEVSQERFLLNNLNNTSTKYYWYIPITWTKSSNINFSDTTPKYWLSKPKAVFDVGKINNDWIIFNIQQTGYYRVNYDDALWTKIIKTLNGKNYNNIHEINRAAIIDDLFNLARAGYVDYGFVLSATQYLAQETNYLPWQAAFNNLEYLYRKLSDNVYHISLFREHLSKIFLPIYLKSGLTIGTSQIDNLLQINTIDWACKLNVTSCFLYSIQKFNDWRYNASELVPVDLRKTIYCTSIKSGHSEHWDFLWNKYLQTNSQYEKEVIVHALGCTMDRNKIHQFLTNAITEGSGIRFQDSLNVFSSIYSSGHLGTSEALDFLSVNYQKVYNYYKDYNIINRILKDLSSYLFTKELLLKFEQFIKMHGNESPLLQKTLKLYATQARDDIKSFEIYRPKIYEWLNATYVNTGYRLPKNIVPIKYNVQLIPYLEPDNFTFDGLVTMILRVTESTSSIVLHSNQLEISEINVRLAYSNASIAVTYYSFSSFHKIIIYLKSIVEAEKHLIISIKYSGILNNKMEGFYRSYYVADDNSVHWLATTQFNQYGARQAFPCLDEPALKARFTISIKRLSNYHSLSNMNLSLSVPTEDPKWIWDIYKESELMSTYLVAFVVSDFKYNNHPDGSFRIWSRPNAIQHTGNAFQSGLNSFKFLQNYTDIPYPLEKMDLIAIPDIPVGAMENWGLITFKEHALLSDIKLTPTYFMRSMEFIIAHELTHMWFGNLVTCEWWEYVWLNEGFAQYFQWYVMDALQPQSRLMEQFPVYELQMALLKDSYIHIRPMNNKMADPYDNGKDFTTVVYKKSASIIRMMQYAFGEKTFHKSLKFYLKQNQYGTSTPSKLWTALQTKVSEAGGIAGTHESVSTLMDSWTSQPGYPLVEVRVVGTTLNLNQERFFITGKNISHQELYWIPITIATKSNPDFSNTSTDLWLGSKGESVNILNAKDEWLILNVQQIGFYRVNYDINIWKSIFKALNQTSFGGIPEINRAQIIDDLLNLARADYISYNTVLDEMQYFVTETGHLPWRALLNNVLFLYERFDGQDVAVGFNKYLIKLISPIFRRVGFQNRVNDTQLDKLNRVLILSWACKLEHPDCVNESKKLFKEYRLNLNSRLSADAKLVVFCTVLKYGDDNDWQFLWQQYRASNLESEKSIILQSLGCSQNKTAINKYFSYIFSSEGLIRNQNVPSAFASVYSSGKYGIDASLDFLMKNYSAVYKYYDSWSPVGQQFINVASKVSTSSQLSKLALFAQNKKDELQAIGQSLNQSIVIASINRQWYKSHYVDIEKWLTNKKIITPDDDDNNYPGAAVSISVQTNTLSIIVMLYILSIFL